MFSFSYHNAMALHGHNKILIFIISNILAVHAGVIKEECNGVKLNSVYHDLEVLKQDLDRPYLLAVDHSTNTLYFSYTINGGNEVIHEEDEFKTARINLNTKEFKTIAGVNNGFAQTVNQKTHEIFIGGSDGLYKYDYATDKAEFLGLKDNNIWNVYFHDSLYYSVFPDQFVYTFEQGHSVRFKDLQDTKVDSFVIDNNNTIFYTNATGLFSQEKGVQNSSAVFYKDHPKIGVRGMTTDVNGKVYVCVRDGIYVVDTKKVVLEKVIDVDDAFGLTFDNDNHLIYSDATSLVRLKPNRSKSC